MARWASTVGLFVTLAASVDVTFFEGGQCETGPIYGGNVSSTVPCYALDKHLDVAPGNSTAVENIIAGQTVLFYADANCQEEVYATESSACYTPPETGIAALQVVQSPSKTTALSIASPQAAFAMSDYRFAPQLGLSGPAIGLGVGYLTAAGLTISGTFVGCATANGAALSVYSCAASVAGQALLYVITGIAGVFAARFKLRADRMLGNYIDVKKRDVDDFNHDYMDFLMNTTVGATHVGYTDRDIGTGILQTSPVWHFTSPTGDAHHITAFYDHNSGDVVHSFLLTGDSSFEKRQAPANPNGITWKSGGIDFKNCDYNLDADLTYFRTTPGSTLFNEFYQDIQCLASPEQFSASNTLSFSVNNPDGVLVAQVFMSTFEEGAATKIDSVGTCGKITSTPFDQVCVF